MMTDVDDGIMMINLCQVVIGPSHPLLGRQWTADSPNDFNGSVFPGRQLAPKGFIRSRRLQISLLVTHTGLVDCMSAPHLPEARHSKTQHRRVECLGQSKVVAQILSRSP